MLKITLYNYNNYSNYVNIILYVYYNVQIKTPNINIHKIILIKIKI